MLEIHFLYNTVPLKYCKACLKIPAQDSWGSIYTFITD